jgi:hypothetical protein
VCSCRGGYSRQQCHGKFRPVCADGPACADQGHQREREGKADAVRPGCQSRSESIINVTGEALGLPPLHPGQALALRLLNPVRPRIRAEDSASGAHHARTERWHRHVIGPRVRAQDRRGGTASTIRRATARRSGRRHTTSILAPVAGSTLLSFSSSPAKLTENLASVAG